LKIHRNIDSFNSAKKTVLTIGTFDGAHRGHIKVFDELKKSAQKINGESIIMTFWPHPVMVLAPTKKVTLLNCLDEKTSRLSNVGIDHLIVYPFSHEFSQLSPYTFVKEILVKKLNISTLVFGHDHAFGKNKEGNYENLVKFGNELGFNVVQVDEYKYNNFNISSTIIRNLINAGDLNQANELLGYNYTLEGYVITGYKLGRTIGFPTANIEPCSEHKLIPSNGVYAVQVNIEDQKHYGMLNIGFKPTVEKELNKPTIEVHIFNFEGNLYDKKISIEFHKKIREEKKFASINELKAQLEHDNSQIRNLFGV
jgi:riboflavin kinase/FMN adenylyltransferase